MANEAAAKSTNSQKPILVSQTSDINDYRATALAELKSLCEKNQLYWPASDIEGYPAEGHNHDDTLLCVFQAPICFQQHN